MKDSPGIKPGSSLAHPMPRDWIPRLRRWYRSGRWRRSAHLRSGLEWGTSKALAAGATEEEVAGVLLAVAPVIGLGRLVAAAPAVADGLEYDVEAALEDPGGR